MEKVGMIGVGAMGIALLERLKLAAVQPVVYDSYAPALEAARSMEAKIAPSAAALARESTMIDIVVRTDQDVLDCMMGKGGVLEGAQADTLILLHGTILPQTTKKVADAAAQKQGVHVIDACMLGVPNTVLEGNLCWVVGGPVELVERARPHLLRMGKQIFHMGPLGSGNVAKLMANLVTGSETLIIHEALRIGEAAGIPYREALEMLRQIHHESVLNRWQGTFDPTGVTSTPRAGRNIFGKDLPLAAELARQCGLNLPITEQLVAAAKRIVGGKA